MSTAATEEIDTTTAAAAAVLSPPEEEEVEQNIGGDETSFLEAAAAAAASAATNTKDEQTTESPDIENQRPKFLAVSDPSVGILADDDDDGSTDSVFSFDSFEMKRRVPLKFQSFANPNNASSDVPFPSVRATNDYMASEALVMTENICPCQCLFFTVKETICLVMSALGCAVFLAGLIVLCLYLEGSLFPN